MDVTYVSELEAKLHLLERFVKFLVLFGVDSDLLARAEDAMWSAPPETSDSTSLSGSDIVSNNSTPTRMSSCEFAVDSSGFKIPLPHMLKRASLSQQQLDAVLSIERICQRLSGTDLGSLEDSTDSFSRGSNIFSVSSEFPPISAPTPTPESQSDALSSQLLYPTTESTKPLKIRVPLTEDSPRRATVKPSNPSPQICKPIPKKPTSVISQRRIRKELKSKDIAPLRPLKTTLVDSKQISSTPSSPTVVRPRRIIARKPPPALNTAEKKTPNRKPLLDTSFSSNRSCPKLLSTTDSPKRSAMKDSSLLSSVQYPKVGRPSLYKPTLSSSLKGGSVKSGKFTRAHVKRKSLTNVF